MTPKKLDIALKNIPSLIVINADSIVVTAAIPKGARISAAPLISIPNIGTEI
mgnify:CR=1 FL=1